MFRRLRFNFDALNIVLLVASLIFLVLHMGWFSYFACGGMFSLFMFRGVSRDSTARAMENSALVNMFSSVKNRFRGMGRAPRPVRAKIPKSKEYKIVKCPKCRQQLRLPRGKGKLIVTCKSCGEKFSKRT